MKWLRGTLLVVIVAGMFAAVSGVARADDGSGGTVSARCSLSFTGGVLGLSCTTSAGVTYTCTLQRTATGTFVLACSNTATATKLTCTFTVAPFSVTCQKKE